MSHIVQTYLSEYEFCLASSAHNNWPEICKKQSFGREKDPFPLKQVTFSVSFS